MRPRRFSWLNLPLFLVAFAVVSCGSPQPEPPEPIDTYSIVAPHSPQAPVGASIHAADLGHAVIADVAIAEACHFGNPGCDPGAFQRIRDAIARWRQATGCTVTEIRVGASADASAAILQRKGDNTAAALGDEPRGIGAAAVTMAVPSGVVLLVPPLGRPATFFGVIPVSDCSAHPKPGLGG